MCKPSQHIQEVSGRVQMIELASTDDC